MKPAYVPLLDAALKQARGGGLAARIRWSGCRPMPAWLRERLLIKIALAVLQAAKPGDDVPAVKVAWARA